MTQPSFEATPVSDDEETTIPRGTLVVGVTRSGKSNVMRQFAFQSLRRGEAIVLIDTVGHASDYAGLSDWFTAEAHTTDAAERLFAQLESERDRRLGVLHQEGVEEWSSLPEAIRKAERFVPLTVLVENFDYLTAERAIQAAVLRIATTGRKLGIFLQVATQRPHTSTVTSDLRANLSTIVTAHRSNQPGETELQLAFGAQAEEAQQLFNSSTADWTGVLKRTGRDLIGFTTHYPPLAEMCSRLGEAGIPKPEKWDPSDSE